MRHTCLRMSSTSPCKRCKIVTQIWNSIQDRWWIRMWGICIRRRKMRLHLPRDNPLMMIIWRAAVRLIVGKLWSDRSTRAMPLVAEGPIRCAVRSICALQHFQSSMSRMKLSESLVRLCSATTKSKNYSNSRSLCDQLTNHCQASCFLAESSSASNRNKTSNAFNQERVVWMLRTLSKIWPMIIKLSTHQLTLENKLMTQWRAVSRPFKNLIKSDI